MRMIRLFAISVLFLCTMCHQARQGEYLLMLKGSESMNETFQALKEDFELRQDSIKVKIGGGGSRIGLNAIASGKADIGLSSFNFNLDSILGLNHKIAEQVVAYDGIVLVNHAENPVRQLSNDQVSGIFSGQYVDWAQLGGTPGVILPIVRDENSGTQKFFKQYFGILEVADNAMIAQENTEIVHEILGDRHSIGFIGLSYSTVGVNDILIPTGVDSSDAFVEPSARSLIEGTYPLKRALRIYFESDITPQVKGFLTYLNSNEAKLIVERYGLIPEVGMKTKREGLALGH